MSKSLISFQKVSRYIKKLKRYKTAHQLLCISKRLCARWALMIKRPQRERGVRRKGKEEPIDKIKTKRGEISHSDVLVSYYLSLRRSDVWLVPLSHMKEVRLSLMLHPCSGILRHIAFLCVEKNYKFNFRSNFDFAKLWQCWSLRYELTHFFHV